MIFGSPFCSTTHFCPLLSKSNLSLIKLYPRSQTCPHADLAYSGASHYGCSSLQLCSISSLTIVVVVLGTTLPIWTRSYCPGWKNRLLSDNACPADFTMACRSSSHTQFSDTVEKTHLVAIEARLYLDQIFLHKMGTLHAIYRVKYLLWKWKNMTPLFCIRCMHPSLIVAKKTKVTSPWIHRLSSFYCQRILSNGGFDLDMAQNGIFVFVWTTSNQKCLSPSA